MITPPHQVEFWQEDSHLGERQVRGNQKGTGGISVDGNNSVDGGNNKQGSTIAYDDHADIQHLWIFTDWRLL